MKKRGYYTIELKSEEGEPVEVTGHFSNNFWALFEEQNNLNSLDECFAFLGKGIGISKSRSIIFCSVDAYCGENGLRKPFNTLYELGDLMAGFTSDSLATVIDALTESRILGNDLSEEANDAEKGQKTKGKKP